MKQDIILSFYGLKNLTCFKFDIIFMIFMVITIILCKVLSIMRFYLESRHLIYYLKIITLMLLMNLMYSIILSLLKIYFGPAYQKSLHFDLQSIQLFLKN